MHTLTSLLLRALVAATMICGAGHASAGALYHVSIDTRALPGTGGYLDFLFAGPVSSATPTATVSNLAGSFDAADTFAWGSPLGSLASGLTLGNADEFGTWAHFGGILSFDLGFSGTDDPGVPGIALSVALLDADQFSYAPGTTGNVATFSLQAGVPADVAVDGDLATVTPIPEPATTAQMAAGLVLLAGALRRRRR
jgi:hypothetical protein